MSEIERDPNNGAISGQAREAETTVSTRSLAAQIIYLILTVVVVVLLLRFTLIIMGANESSGFVEFIYDFSRPLVSPFYGIFNNDFEYGQGDGRFDFETLFAIAIYSIIAFIAVKAVSLGKRNVQP